MPALACKERIPLVCAGRLKDGFSVLMHMPAYIFAVHIPDAELILVHSVREPEHGAQTVYGILFIGNCKALGIERCIKTFGRIDGS